MVTDVFLRGVQHIFYDEDERNAFVNNLAAYTDKLPLVPVSVVARMIENAVNMASASVTNALTTSYHEYGDAVRGRRHHELAVRRHPLEDPHTESQRKKAHEKPFEHVLRYNMCLELMDPKEDIFGRLQLVMPESMPGQDKRANFPTSKAPFSAIFHSFRLIFGRAIISRNVLEAWMLFPERARAEHSR